MIYRYVCPTCGATKKIHDNHHEQHTVPPNRVICGWRGCYDYAVKR